jgi:serine/threonine-protein kinase ULK2
MTVEPLREPDMLTRHETDTDRQIRRRKQVLIDARSNAVICVHVYMRVMGFSQKGINQLRLFQEHRKMLFPNNEFEISEGFDDGLPYNHIILLYLMPTLALSWFKERFVKCHERTTLVKTWLPLNCVLGDPDQIRHGLYDRALFLVSIALYFISNTDLDTSTQSSVAARRELFEDSYDPKECEKYYEESLWCLYTLADDLMPRRMSPTTDDDDDLVSTCKLLTILEI